ncbi:MAG TPA: type IV pili twitching motility protein PilT, partial [Cellvibrionaceae bacterium]|nr:type IV pili twitching motility protein PilT [Cellvibrionaceae bacterium]
MDIDRLLQLMVEKGASDLFITAGVPPSMKLHGKIVPVTTTPLSPEKSRETVLSTMNEKQRAEFVERKELNFAISVRGVGRFRA